MNHIIFWNIGGTRGQKRKDREGTVPGYEEKQKQKIWKDMGTETKGPSPVSGLKTDGELSAYAGRINDDFYTRIVKTFNPSIF